MVYSALIRSGARGAWAKYPRTGRRGSAVLSITLGWIIVMAVAALLFEELQKTRQKEWLSGVALEIAVLMDRYDQAVHQVRNTPGHAAFADLASLDRAKVFPAALIAAQMQMSPDPARWFGKDSVTWQTGRAGQTITLTFHTAHLSKYGVAAGMGLMDTSGLSAAQENWFLEQLILGTGGSLEDIHRAMGEYKRRAGTLSDQQWAVYAHWFSGLNEDFLFRERRPREAPNVMQVPVDMGQYSIVGINDIIPSGQSGGTHRFASSTAASGAVVSGPIRAKDMSLTGSANITELSGAEGGSMNIAVTGTLGAPQMSLNGALGATTVSETPTSSTSLDSTTGRNPQDGQSRTGSATVSADVKTNSLQAAGRTLGVSGTMGISAGGLISAIEIYAPFLRINQMTTSECTGC